MLVAVVSSRHCYRAQSQRIDDRNSHNEY